MPRGGFLLVLAAALALAFAPAPLPRPSRRGEFDLIDLRLFQGKWKIVRNERVVGPGQLAAWHRAGPAVAVRVSEGQWTYLEPGDRVNNVLLVEVAARRGETAITWYRSDDAQKKRPIMLGLIRRRGGTVQIVGMGGVPVEQRPARFVDAPVGWWVMTLERAR
jgi:hypothetical protein